MRRANGIHGASRARNGTSTPFQKCETSRTASVIASAPASSASEEPEVAKPQSSGGRCDTNQVSWASTIAAHLARCGPWEPARAALARGLRCGDLRQVRAPRPLGVGERTAVERVDQRALRAAGVELE